MKRKVIRSWRGEDGLIKKEYAGESLVGSSDKEEVKDETRSKKKSPKKGKTDSNKFNSE